MASKTDVAGSELSAERIEELQHELEYLHLLDKADGQLHELKRQLRKKGGYPRDLAALMRHLQMAIDGHFVPVSEASEKFQRVERILGRNFISPDLLREAGVSYSDEQVKAFAHALPPFHELDEIQDRGAVLLPGPPQPMGLMDITRQFDHVDVSHTLPRHEWARNSERVHPRWLVCGRYPEDDWRTTPPPAARMAWCLCVFRVTRGSPLPSWQCRSHHALLIVTGSTVVPRRPVCLADDEEGLGVRIRDEVIMRGVRTVMLTAQPI